MKKFLTLCFSTLFSAWAFGQSAPNFFQKVQDSQIFLPETAETVTMPDEFLTFSIDFDGIRNHLRSAPFEGTAAAKSGSFRLQLPMPDGTMETFRVWESPVMHPDLAAKYPMIKTFGGAGVENPSNTVRLGFGLDGFHAVVLAPGGGSLVMPYATNQTQYYLCFRQDLQMWKGLDVPPTLVKYEPMEGETAPVLDQQPTDQEVTFRGGGEGGLVELRKYRFALACTGEYAVNHGGTMASVLSSLVTAANTLNSVVGRDADMQLVLIPNDTLLIFLDPNDDPYQNSTMGTALLGQNEEVLNNIVGLSSFDVGHVFTGACSDVGGVVSGSVCSAGKARGVTCHFSDNVVATTLSIAAHEMGHQFSAGHTFAYCGDNLVSQYHSGSAAEPGSGSTILSYQGSCGASNIPGPANVHYHGKTMEEFWTYTHLSGGNICPQIIETSNHAPVVTVNYPTGFHIPISTPFELNGSATDEDGDPLTYIWEQIDLGLYFPIDAPIGDMPLFRTFDPSANGKRRIFPKLSTILNNSFDVTEQLPTYTRNMNFRLSARDNNMSENAGGVTWADVSFKATATAGPFLVMYPNASTDALKAGDEVEITWDVANTDNSLVNCKSVNILLSVDGGQTFPHVLVSATPNDGAEAVFVPNVTATNARVRIEAADNIFFDLSNQNFPIAPADEPGFSLSISPQFQEVCVPNNASTQLNTGSILNFDMPVQMEILGGLPADASASFSVNPVAPGQSTTINFDFGSSIADGNYEVELRAIAGEDTVLRTLYLNLVYSDFSALELTGPTDGQSSLGLLPTFNWSNLIQADGYDFQLATSPTFEASTIVDEAFNLVQPTYVPTVALIESTIYYWRVRPFNQCLEGDFATAKTFQTFTVSCAPYNSIDVPKNISNIGLPVVESVLPILQAGIISDINVTQLKGEHDALADIEVLLTSPQGTEVTLFSQICGNVIKFDFGLNDESPFVIDCPPLNGLAYKPEEPLSTFIGENTLGEWKLTLKVVDNAGQGGFLEKWGIEFCASITPNSPFMVNNDTIYVKPLETRLIHNFELAVEDSDNPGNELQFTIVDETDEGYLSKNGVKLELGDHFTMTDIHLKNITYTNTNPDAVYDFFTFVVEDGTGGWLGTPRMNIVIDENATTGTGEIDFAEGILVAPNPASNRLNVSFTAPLTNDGQLAIADVQGRTLAQQKLASGTQRLELDLSSLTNGVYFLAVNNGEGVFTKKFVVSK